MDEEQTNIVDWRVRAAMSLAEDIPPAYPGGPSHKAGSLLYLFTNTPGTGRYPLGFLTPSSTALALSISMQSSIRAAEMLSELRFTSVVGPQGPGEAVASEDIGKLFDFFEQCMITIAFSFQALETFCNEEISNRVEKSMIITKDKREENLTTAELERNLSTEDKLHYVLPQLYQVESPKRAKIWSNFKRLKKARDSVIHLKAHASYPNQAHQKFDKSSLFYFFMTNRMQFFPKTAIEMLLYFEGKDELILWLEKAKEFATKYKNVS